MDYEAKILDQFAAELGKQEILELVLSKAVQLASVVDAMLHTNVDQRTEADYKVLVAPKVARMALVLDVLQLKCGNVEEQELEYMQVMEQVLSTFDKE